MTCMYIVSCLGIDPKRQMQLAVLAVFDSWDSPRAKKYRSINKITGLRGTAVNVQCMVFGNMGNTSGTGVLFTRNPSTGEKKLYGEFLVNAQVSLSSTLTYLLLNYSCCAMYVCTPNEQYVAPFGQITFRKQQQT